MSLCMATASIAGKLPAKLQAIAAAGFEGVELSEAELSDHGGIPEDIAQFSKDLGLRIEALRSSGDYVGLLAEDRLKAQNDLDQTFALMHRLDAETLLIGTSTDINILTDPDEVHEDFVHLAERARVNGVKIAVLALPWASHLNDELRVFEVVKRVDSPHLGVALNSVYSLLGQTQAARLRVISGDKVFHVHLADTVASDFDPPRLEKLVGLLPGQGQLNLESFVRVLVRSGFKGPWSLAGGDAGQQEGYTQSAKDGYRALVSLLDEVSLTEPRLDKPVSDLPPRGYPSGFEFLEFAVDEVAKQSLTNVLTAMCFRRERRHVSKSVELWRQGAVNIVINSEKTGFAAEAFAAHGPTVCDMGLKVRDADAVVARATALGAPAFEQPVGAGELAIPAIQGVGGNVVHFIDEESDLHRVWDIEFDPVSKAKATPPAGLRRIDHVAQTMPYDEMQSWLTYYTTTFQMEKTPVVDVDDPSGVVLSQALSSPEGEVRLNLNGADQDKTFAGAFLADQFGAGVQHVAFVSDDIFETSDRLASAGFERLAMPDSYYKDLALRFGLEPEFVWALREGQMLYDRDQAGEYFQIYGAPMFNGFFFEIVQRKGGYQGYGAPNAPIRLAAQLKYLQERQAA